MRSGQTIKLDLTFNGSNYGSVNTDADGASAMQAFFNAVERAQRNAGK